MKIALYQPDIPQNVGAMMRLCACLDIDLEIIEPCGFPWDEKKMQRAGMDYINLVTVNKHNSWQAFTDAHKDHRIILMTTKSSQSYTEFKFQKNDILLAGQESVGAPENVHKDAHGRVAIPMKTGLRSLNIVNASAMIIGEALRQTGP